MMMMVMIIMMMMVMIIMMMMVMIIMMMMVEKDLCSISGITLFHFKPLYMNKEQGVRMF